MRIAWVVLLLPLGSAATSGQDQAPPAREAVEFFERRVRPVLTERCLSCHSADKKKSGLALDSREAILKGGMRGPAIDLKHPGESLLVAAVRWKDEELRMPKKAEQRLSDAQIADLEKWIAMGAPYPAAASPAPPAEHWAFKPVASRTPPDVDQEGWVRTPVDRFILARLEGRGLAPVADADKRALIRRATFDLTGLPPTPEEVEAFVADEDEGAFVRVVDRLLASPHYGERWGRHWLDVARYADTAGESSDYPVPQAYRYRNWVIDAFNRDLPYDQFLREQLAGDLLPSASEKEKYERIVATGFVALSRRFSVNPVNDHHLTIEDTIDTMGRAVLGLALSCARCHDHKFDPIPSEDYYGLYGIFASTRYPFPGSEEQQRQRDLVPLMRPEEVEAAMRPYRERLAELDAKLKRLEGERDAAAKEGGDAQKAAADAFNAAKRERDAFASRPPKLELAYAVVDAKPQNARMHLRGNPHNRGREVPRRFLRAIGGGELPKGTAGSGRRELAEWLVDPANPLTARVMANRIWLHHFGRGLVATPSDFGRQGQPPTHPELLDWLAERFIVSGWSVKAMHRLIMLSRAYGLACEERAANAAADPGNELLWRANRRRLDAESVRDAMLEVSGELDRRVAGPHPFPAEHRWNFTQHNPFAQIYETKHRSVYVMQPRIRKHPFFAAFDGADPNQSTGARLATTTPLQSLFLMNDKFVHESADKFAARLEGTDEQRIDRAFRLAFARPPSEMEMKACRDHVGRTGSWASLVRVLFCTNEFIYVD